MAVRAVKLAGELAQKIQAGCDTQRAIRTSAEAFGPWQCHLQLLILSIRTHCLRIMMKEEEGLDTKKDRSLVTTADYAAQAIISW